MAAITTIQARISTAQSSPTGVNSWMYVGIAGREFRADSVEHDDYEPGQDFTFIFGDGENVLDGSRNDPRQPQLDTEDLDLHPVYLRWNPIANSPDRWDASVVEVSVNPGSAGEARFVNPRIPGGSVISLGHSYGLRIFLRSS